MTYEECKELTGRMLKIGGRSGHDLVMLAVIADRLNEMLEILKEDPPAEPVIVEEPLRWPHVQSSSGGQEAYE